MKKAIIFDLDGTLWDSSESCAASWNIILEQHPDISRRITLADMHGFMGKTLDVIAPIALPEVQEPRRMEIMRECVRFELEYIGLHGGVLYPKLRETLEQLRRDYSLMVVSNCQDGYIQLFLKYSGMGTLFDDFESAGATGLCKWENIRLVIKRNSVSSAVYVGDTQGDLDAADMAGIPFIHAAYGFGITDREVPAIKAFSDLPGMVKTLI